MLFLPPLIWVAAEKIGKLASDGVALVQSLLWCYDCCGCFGGESDDDGDYSHDGVGIDVMVVAVVPMAP